MTLILIKQTQTWTDWRCVWLCTCCSSYCWHNFRRSPLDVSFTCDSTTGNEPFTYCWDFNNDGTEDSTEQNPTHTFVNGGDFDATCTITDADGYTSSDSVTIMTINLSLQDQKAEQITILESLIDDASKKIQASWKMSISRSWIRWTTSFQNMILSDVPGSLHWQIRGILSATPAIGSWNGASRSGRLNG